LPNLYIISGCNGAGKTTASFTILPEILNCKEFINADEIARGISPFQPETVSFEAGRIMLDRINNLLEQKTDFAIETTLTTLSYQQTIARAKLNGYKVSLLFFWLNDVQLAIQRVKKRVMEGGHNIPEETITRRYARGIINLTNVFLKLSDYWLVIDNSNPLYTFVVEGNNGLDETIFNYEIWDKIKKTKNEN